jgi:hypothetical protein
MMASEAFGTWSPAVTAVRTNSPAASAERLGHALVVVDDEDRGGLFRRPILTKEIVTRRGLDKSMLISPALSCRSNYLEAFGEPDPGAAGPRAA